MRIRRRLVLLSSCAVALAIAVAAVAVYLLVRANLRGQVDDALRAAIPRAYLVMSRTQAPDPAAERGLRVALPPGKFGEVPGIAQLLTSRGEVVAPPAAGSALITQAVRVAARRATDGAVLTDEHAGGVHLRVLSTRQAGGDVLQIARPLTGVDRTLATLRWVLLGVMAGGIALAAALNSRLGRSFNGMLEALESSREAQRQLVADASHELRTPLTSVRTNVELLARAPDLPEAERERIVASVDAQVQELSVLVGDLVDLARPADRAADDPELEDVALDVLVAEAVDAARAHAGGRALVVDAEPCVVRGSRARLHRAVRNLLDNAVKWSPPDGVIEIAVRGGEVVVRDHGPGIADEDLPHVFDRFYRSADARGLPGSGLGLAIVRQVAEAHGGSVRAERAEGGGARLRLALSPSS